jgi:hypothetical protein
MKNKYLKIVTITSLCLSCIVGLATRTNPAVSGAMDRFQFANASLKTTSQCNGDVANLCIYSTSFDERCTAFCIDTHFGAEVWRLNKRAQRPPNFWVFAQNGNLDYHLKKNNERYFKSKLKYGITSTTYLFDLNSPIGNDGQQRNWQYSKNAKLNRRTDSKGLIFSLGPNASVLRLLRVSVTPDDTVAWKACIKTPIETNIQISIDRNGGGTFENTKSNITTNNKLKCHNITHTFKENHIEFRVSIKNTSKFKSEVELLLEDYSVVLHKDS